MIDSHCHLDLAAFDNDRHEVISRALSTGVSRLHIPGTTYSGWDVQQSLATQYPEIDYSIGLHPYFLNSESEFDCRRAELILNQAKVLPLAIGEIGLDAAIDVPYAVQSRLCLEQLAFAQQHELPVIMHHRKSSHELLSLIKQVNFTHGGIVHAFSGSTELAKQFIDVGFCLGIGGTITYSRAQKTIRAVQQIDVQHLVIETDAPDMPIYGRQGQRNEPAYLVDVGKQLANLKNMSLKAIIEHTTRNYFRIFARNLRMPLSK